MSFNTVSILTELFCNSKVTYTHALGPAPMTDNSLKLLLQWIILCTYIRTMSPDITQSYWPLCGILLQQWHIWRPNWVATQKMLASDSGSGSSTTEDWYQDKLAICLMLIPYRGFMWNALWCRLTSDKIKVPVRIQTARNHLDRNFIQWSLCCGLTSNKFKVSKAVCSHC